MNPLEQLVHVLVVSEQVAQGSTQAVQLFEPVAVNPFGQVV
jgi:hypothetical protein